MLNPLNLTLLITTIVVYIALLLNQITVIESEMFLKNQDLQMFEPELNKIPIKVVSRGSETQLIKLKTYTLTL